MDSLEGVGLAGGSRVPEQRSQADEDNGQEFRVFRHLETSQLVA
jgi:hypothetical protein